MKKIKVSADAVLAILQDIMNDADINYKITDVSAPEDWQGKTVQEALNVEYYTFKHRPADTEIVIRQLLEQGQSASLLLGTTRSFCLLSLTSTERVFSKQMDTVTVSANLEYWVQSEKVKLLENMFEDIAVETNGIRIPVQIGTEGRQVLIALDSLNISELQENTEFGEMAVCDIDISLVFYQPAYSQADYTVEFLVDNAWVELPFSSISLSTSMNQRSSPRVNQVRSVGSINLSRVKSVVLTFEGLKNPFIDKLSKDTLSGEVGLDGAEIEDIDNNKSYVMRLTRGEDQFVYDTVVKEHDISVKNDGYNEVHSLTLTTRGLK